MPRWGQKFLDALREEKSVSHAAKKVNKGRRTVYTHRAKSKVFADAWDEVLDECRDELQQSAWDIAVNGIEEPVFDKDGIECGTKRRIFPALMIFMLKRQIPATYGDHLDRVNTPTDDPDDRVDYV